MLYLYIFYIYFNQIFLFLPLPDNVSNALLKPFTFEGVGIVGLLFPGRGGGGKFCYNIQCELIHQVVYNYYNYYKYIYNIYKYT